MTALGTVFTVERERQNLVVTLVEGKVAVSAGIANEVPIEMTSGQELTLSNTGKAALRSGIDPELALAWREGKLVFDNEPLERVVARMNNYVSTPITVQADIAKLPISGVFKAGDTTAFIGAVKTYFAIEEVRTARGILLMRGIGATALRLARRSGVSRSLRGEPMRNIPSAISRVSRKTLLAFFWRRLDPGDWASAEDAATYEFNMPARRSRRRVARPRRDVQHPDPVFARDRARAAQRTDCTGGCRSTQALGALLANTKLTYTRTAANVYLVTQAAPAAMPLMANLTSVTSIAATAEAAARTGRARGNHRHRQQAARKHPGRRRLRCWW